MILRRIKRNLGFMLAGAILFGVGVNVYIEVNRTYEEETECRSTSIP